jgi:predicted outer membrane repeat protein
VRGGQLTLTATFTPRDTTVYTTTKISVTLTVNKAVPVITWAVPNKIPYGTALSAAQLNATASVPGSFVYTPAPGTVLTPGSKALSVTFTPENTIDYSTATARVGVTVIVIPPFVVNTNADDSGTAANCASGSSTPCSLRDALTASQSAGGDITFAPAVFNASNSSAQNTITLGSAGTLAIPAYTTITGATSGSGATLTNLVTVSGKNTYGVFSVASSVVEAAISNLTITQGADNAGGAINNSGALTVNACTFTNNAVSAEWVGGAIENSGQLTVNDSTFANNNAPNAGGAIYSTGTLTVNNSTFTGNTGGQGGAIYNGGTLTMTNSTISGNTGSGAGIFNEGLAMGSNNIISGDTGGECAGNGCFDDTYTNAAYFLVSGAEQQIGGVWDTGDITLAWSDNRGNHYSYTVNYGQFSVPAGISSSFGGGITNYDSPGSDAEGFGSFFVLVVDPASSGPYATIGSITITNTGKSFAVTQVNQTLLDSSYGNIVGSAANLSPLGNYGGPTQTMVPPPGSSAICAGLVSGVASGVTTDQRGFPNTNTSYPGYSIESPCVDVGSVQTNYALNFTTQPPASVTATVPFSAAVGLDESGSLFTASSVAIPLTLTGNGGLLNASANTASGIATYPALSVTLPGTNDQLNASLPVTGSISIAAASDGFNVIAVPTTTAASSQTVTYSPNAQGITLTAQVTASTGIVNAGTVTFEVLQGSSMIGTATTTATVSNGSASAIYTLPGGAVVGKYIISAVYNAGGAFATSSDNTQSITVTPATPTITWATPASIPYGTALGSAQLDATSPVTGNWAYLPASGTILGVGPQTLKATLTPTDAKDYTTATATVMLTVTKAATTTKVVPSINPSAVNQSVTFTATVTAAYGTPTGTVTFLSNGTSIGTGTLAGGVATLSTSTLPVGTNSITVMFGGSTDYNASTSPALSEVTDGTFAALTSPTPGSVLGTTNVVFSWTPAAGATEYDLYLGTTGVGSANLYNSAGVTTTSVTVPTVPSKGVTVYARLYYQIKGAWQYTDYTYTETPVPPALTTPAQGSVLGTTNVVFSWTPGGGEVTQYDLYLGTTAVGSDNLYNSAGVTATSVTVPTLPSKGATVYARLYYQIKGVWQSIDYTYTESQSVPPVLTSPTTGSVLGTTNVIFSWTPGAGVTEYDLYLGTTGVGSMNLYNSAGVTTTSVTVAKIPALGATVYARLYYQIKGAWQYADYTYTEQ